MKSFIVTLLLSVVMLLSSCTWIWAQMVSSKVADDLLSIESYRARLVEEGPLQNGRRVRAEHEILYQKPWKVRSVATAPPEREGELFIYDGSKIIMWWPKSLFGVLIRGAATPPESAIRSAIEKSALWSMKNYAFSYQGDENLAARRAARWKVLPVREAPYLFPYDSWMDKSYSTPLKVVVYEKPGKVWYSMHYEKLAFGVPVPQDSFSFDFPPNAVVFEWDLNDPGLPFGEMQKLMNFDLLLPQKLPEGHSVKKIIKGRHCLPMAAVIMDEEGRWLSLTEVRSLGAAFEPETGLPIKLGERKAWLNFMGAFTSISWSRGDTALTLIGNLPYPEMIETAASVGPPLPHR